MAEESFNIVKNWLDNNSLDNNSKKTKYIHFDIQKSINLNNYKIIAHSKSCVIRINKNKVCKCRELNRVNSIKYLCLYIDANLKWDVGTYNFINDILRKIFYIYKSLRSILNFKLKKNDIPCTKSIYYFLWDLFLEKNILYSLSESRNHFNLITQVYFK